MTQHLPMSTIQAVADRLHLPKSTIRYWEREFAPLIRPQRTQGGQRRYSEHDVIVIAQIQQQKKSGLSIAEIRRNLTGLKPECGEDDHPAINQLAEEIVNTLRSKIVGYLKSANSIR